MSHFLETCAEMAALGASNDAPLTRILALLAAGEADAIAQGKFYLRNILVSLAGA